MNSSTFHSWNINGRMRTRRPKLGIWKPMKNIQIFGHLPMFWQLFVGTFFVNLSNQTLQSLRKHQIPFSKSCDLWPRDVAPHSPSLVPWSKGHLFVQLLHRSGCLQGGPPAEHVATQKICSKPTALFEDGVQGFRSVDLLCLKGNLGPRSR